MSAYCILDTETASLHRGVVEVAWLWVDRSLNVLDEQCHRTNPECKIEPGARAVHGISDEDVAGCPTISQVCAGFKGVKIDVIGHNVAFDLRMLKDVVHAKRSLCTLALARQYIKDTTNSKLETLQQELGLEVHKSHSALGDVYTCLNVLKYVLPRSGTDLEGLFRRAEQPRLLHIMPFGKHEGLPMLEVPSGYRNWLYCQPHLDKDLKYTLEKLRSL